MPYLFAIDIGSSSVKSAVVSDFKVLGQVARVPYVTDVNGDCVETHAERILAAIVKAVQQIPANLRRRTDVVAISSMGPSWVAMDRRGRAITPIVTHQDRRSIAEAVAIESRVGRKRHLNIAGARPVPGGISSTTHSWFVRHARSVMKRADLLGHLPTFLLRNFCGVRAIDTSHASFMGLFRTLRLTGWDEELCAAAEVRRETLPQILDGREVAGRLNGDWAARLGLVEGTPVLPGILDGSVPLLAAGLKDGQLVNVAGSTDVLAMCVATRPRVHERLLTRAVGAGRWWAQVSTLAAAGSAIAWARQNFFADCSQAQFDKALREAAGAARSASFPGEVVFEPYLAGDRASIEQKHGHFHGLRLSTSRSMMLRAIVQGLARVGAERVELFRQIGRPRRDVLVSGGVSEEVVEAMQSRWAAAGWRFRPIGEATVAGLCALVQH
jgi:sugar (pentulose or hexulose) kinase